MSGPKRIAQIKIWANISSKRSNERKKNQTSKKLFALVFTSVYFHCLSHCSQFQSVCTCVCVLHCHCRQIHGKLTFFFSFDFKWPKWDVWRVRRLDSSLRSYRSIVNSCHTKAHAFNRLFWFSPLSRPISSRNNSHKWDLPSVTACA